MRLWSGLILAVYVIPHLINHALGLISIGAMESMLEGMEEVWGNPIGTVALYGAFTVHFGLGLLSLFRRDHLRMPVWEAVQVSFGLLIWPLLIGHAMGTRMAAEFLDLDITYRSVVAVLWFGDGYLWLRQIFLLLIVWVHLSVGLHYWLRMYEGYRRCWPVLCPLAVLIPVLAIAGFGRAGADLADNIATDPNLLGLIYAARGSPEAGELSLHGQIETGLMALVLGLIALTLAARVVRRAWRNRHGRFRLVLPDGRQIQAPVGATMLEAIRAAGIPHAAVCGGRGRCTTCRVRVGSGLTHLPPPGEVEGIALARVEAPSGMRLACQVRPQRDAVIAPLLSANVSTAGVLRGGVNGREQTVVILFIDIRGSTRLGERRLPYDVLFILNQFFAEMAGALRATGGHYAQFNGDGLMALYGLGDKVQIGARQALAGSADMLRRLDALNGLLAEELDEPLRVGIGIHCGEAIVGTMGPPEWPILSAIGDSVNVAARLEALTKEMGLPIVISADVAEAAGIDVSDRPHRTVEVRGRSASISVYAIDNPGSLLAGNVQ